MMVPSRLILNKLKPSRKRIEHKMKTKHLDVFTHKMRNNYDKNFVEAILEIRKMNALRKFKTFGKKKWKNGPDLRNRLGIVYEIANDYW